MATGDVLAPAGTLMAANSELRLRHQGGGWGDDANLVIVEPNARPGAPNVVRPLWGRSGPVGSARISRAAAEF